MPLKFLLPFINIVSIMFFRRYLLLSRLGGMHHLQRAGKMNALSTNVRIILGNCRRHIAVSNAVRSCHIPKIFAIKSWSRRENEGWVQIPALSFQPLWTKVHDIMVWGCGPFVVYNAVPQLSIACFITKIGSGHWVWKSSRKITTKTIQFCTPLPIFFGREDPKILQ